MSRYNLYRSNSSGEYIKETLFDVCRELREDGTVTILPRTYFCDTGRWILVSWPRSGKPKYRFIWR